MQWALTLHWKINFYPIHSSTEPTKQQTTSEPTHQAAHAVMETQGEKHPCSVKGRITVTILHMLNLSVVSDSLRCYGPWPPGSFGHGIFRQESWSWLPFSSPGDLPDPESNLHLLHCRQILCHWATWEASYYIFSSVLELHPLRWAGNETNTLWKSQPCPFLTRILPKQVKCGRISYLDLPMPVNDQSNTIRSRLSARICDFSGPPRWHYW